MKSTTKITKVSDLIAILKTANKSCKGQWASISYNVTTALNQFPNEEYCSQNNITLASGKGSKALNEPYRVKAGFSPYRKVKAMFHIGQSYYNTLIAKGGTPSETKDTNTKHLGGGISLKNEMAKYGFIFAYYANSPKGYYINGAKATAEEIDYIQGYKSANNSSYNPLVDYRTPNVRDIKQITFGGHTYDIDITDISDIIAA